MRATSAKPPATLAGDAYLLLLVTIVIVAFANYYIEAEDLRPMLAKRLMGDLLQQAFSGKEQLTIPAIVYLYGGIIGFITALTMIFNGLLPAWFYPRTDEDDDSPVPDDRTASSIPAAVNPTSRPQPASPGPSPACNMQATGNDTVRRTLGTVDNSI